MKLLNRYEILDNDDNEDNKEKDNNDMRNLQEEIIK